MFIRNFTNQERPKKSMRRGFGLPWENLNNDPECGAQK